MSLSSTLRSNNFTLAWKEGLLLSAVTTKKRRIVASKRHIPFQAQETHYFLDNPLEDSLGRWVSTDEESGYAIAPWKINDLRSGWLGAGSLKFGVIVSMLFLILKLVLI